METNLWVNSFQKAVDVSVFIFCITSDFTYSFFSVLPLTYALHIITLKNTELK